MVDKLNLKHFSIIFLVLCALLSVSAISAADNSTDEVIGEAEDAQLGQNNIDTPILANETSTPDSDKNTTDSTSATNSTTQKLKASAPAVYNTYKKKDLSKSLLKIPTRIL